MAQKRQPGIKDYQMTIRSKSVDDFEDWAGRTVKEVVHQYNEFYVVFEDGTFSHVVRQEFYESNELVISRDATAISPRTAVEIGALTEPEAQRYNRLQIKSANDSARTRRRRQYEALRAEFEGGEE